MALYSPIFGTMKAPRKDERVPTYFREFREFDFAWEYAREKNSLGHNVDVQTWADGRAQGPMCRVYFSARRLDIANAINVGGAARARKAPSKS